MGTRWIEVGDGFWNLRGSFRIGGMVDIRTHASLVRLANGKFLFLDAYTLDETAKREADDLIGEAGVAGILNLHPFHTIHVKPMHAQYPDAPLFGTARHVKKFPGLPWAAERSEDESLHRQFADDLEFSIPAGVDFISRNENVHFSSVLAYHKPSRTIHSDDTLMYLQMGPPLGWMGMADSVRFHMTLAQALERRAGAAADFRAWVQDLVSDWGEAQNLCTAHLANLLAAENRGAPVPARIEGALRGVEKVLAKHERRFG